MRTTPAKLLRHAGSWRSLFCILALGGAFVAHAATPPGISNIRAAQRTGTKLVDIQFDLNPVGGSSVPSSILVSSNSGGTWDVPARTFVGDHGAIIAPARTNGWSGTRARTGTGNTPPIAGCKKQIPSSHG